jgi:glycosyltransferase involved in cell wall biosynthesis
VADLVSVVVPVFNGLPYLRELVASLLAQEYSPLEIVFSEGGSTDGSAEYLQTITDPRVRVTTAPEGSGAAGNWTHASQAATGAFIKLVCQDDLLTPDAITRQAAELQQHPTAVMAVARRDIIDARGGTVSKARGGQGLSRGLVAGADVIRACWLQGTNVVGEPVVVLFRRQALLDAMPWRDENPLMLDITTYAAVAPHGDVWVDSASLGAFRVSSSSWSTRLAGVQHAQFKAWQDDYVAALPEAPTSSELRKAARGLTVTTLMRRATYRWLALKGAL